MRKSYILAAVFLFFAIVLASALWILSERSISEIQVQGTGLHVSKRHYMFISDDHSEQGEAIFRAAQRAAEETDAAIEWTGQGLAASYGVEDCMKIASAANPDGIILYQSQGGDLTSRINEAEERGIPVITLLNDAGTSKRESYIGINSYQMGAIYGEQVLRVLAGDSGEVLVLLPGSREAGSDGLLYTQLVRRVEEGRGNGQTITFSTYDVNTENSFDAEEDIRDIFVSGGTLPSVLICLDPVSTECVNQALVDYNEVGNVAVIGYYASESTLLAVEKGLFSATLSVDAEEIGRIAVNAMNEYCASGHVSNYFNVGIEMITEENLEQYRGTERLEEKNAKELSEE